MEDRFGKYLRLLGSIFFLVLGFIVAVILLLLTVRLFFGLMSYIPWITYIYMIFIILVPAALFIPAYIVYHPEANLSKEDRLLLNNYFKGILDSKKYF